MVYPRSGFLDQAWMWCASIPRRCCFAAIGHNGTNRVALAGSTKASCIGLTVVRYWLITLFRLRLAPLRPAGCAVGCARPRPCPRRSCSRTGRTVLQRQNALHELCAQSTTRSRGHGRGRAHLYGASCDGKERGRSSDSVDQPVPDHGQADARSSELQQAQRGHHCAQWRREQHCRGDACAHHIRTPIEKANRGKKPSQALSCPQTLQFNLNCTAIQAASFGESWRA